MGKLCGLLPGCVQTNEQLHTVQVLCGGMQSGHDLTAATESVAILKTALSSFETFSKHYLVSCILYYLFVYILAILRLYVCTCMYVYLYIDL